MLVAVCRIIIACDCTAQQPIGGTCREGSMSGSAFTLSVLAWAAIGVWQTTWGVWRTVAPAHDVAPLAVECLCSCDVRAPNPCPADPAAATTTTSTVAQSDPRLDHGGSWAYLLLRLALELALCSGAALVWLVRRLAGSVAAPAPTPALPPLAADEGGEGDHAARRAPREGLSHLAVDPSTW